MRIASITPVFSPYKGGIGVVCGHNACFLSEYGHVVEILTPQYRGSKLLPQKIESFGGGLIRRLRPFLAYGNAAVLPQLIWRLKNYDAIHLHYPFIGAVIPTIIAKILFKKKLVVTYHMDLFGKGGVRQSIFHYYNRLIMPLLARYADRIIVTSRDYGATSRLSRFIDDDSKKYFEVPNSVSTEQFSPRDKNKVILERHAIGEHDKIILFVGGLDTAHYFKGVDHLIEAFELIARELPKSSIQKHCKLIIVGDGDLRQRYEQKAKELGVSDRIIFAGSVSDKELPEYYNLADVVTLPSIDSSEAFGVVLVEAMACAKPVVASYLPGVRSVVRDGENGYLVKPCDIADLATKILSILVDEDKAKKMGKRGAELVNEHYSHQAMGRKLSSVFKW